MAKPNFILPNKPAIKAGSILSYNYTDDLKFAAEPLDFSRNSSATRVNEQGLIEEVGYFGPQLVQNGDFSQEGPELITNGDFSNGSTGWNKSTQVTIENGVANIISNDGSFQYVGQNNITTIGKSYVLTYTIISNNNGDLRFGNFGGINSTIGTHSFYFVADETACNIARNSAGVTDISIDNVSVKEVGQDWILDAGWSISEGLASRTNTGAYGAMYQNCLESGKKYKVTIKITSITSQAFFGVRLGTNYVLQGITQAGTYTAIGVSTSATLSIMGNPTFAGSIDSIKIIEIIGDKPRIDYSDSSTEPSLLLEPQSTNLIPYSESTNGWNINGNITATSNATISPEGVNNAVKLQNITTSSSNQCVAFNVPSLSGVSVVGETYSASIYIKPVNASDVGKIIELSIQRANGDFESLNVNVEITSADWKRYVITYTFTGAGSGNQTGAIFKILRSSTTIDDIYVFGVQFEESSFATSYIPTLGSIATRLGETANNAGGAGVFNSEEGVLYAEIAALADDGAYREITLSDGTVNNRVELRFTNNSNEIQVVVRAIDGAVQHARQTSAYTITSFNKIAFKYKLNDFAFWINGVEIATGTGGVTPIGLSELAFDAGDGYSDFYGKTKNIQVFNYALTDEELQTLTT
jgi:hypothetical protein